MKEWQAIMAYFKSHPRKNDKGLSLLLMDESVSEDRSINLRASINKPVHI